MPRNVTAPTIPRARGRAAPSNRWAAAAVATGMSVPPPIASLPELAGWFRTKAGGTNSAQGFIQSLGEEEGILYADVDVAAVRRFPGYFYRTAGA